MLFKKFATAKFILPVNSADYVSSVRYRYDLISSFSSWVLTRIPARAVDANVMGIWIEVYGSSCSHRLRYCECNFDRLKICHYVWLWRLQYVWLLTLQLNSSIDNWNMLNKKYCIIPKRYTKCAQLNDFHFFSSNLLMFRKHKKCIICYLRKLN